MVLSGTICIVKRLRLDSLTEMLLSERNLYAFKLDLKRHKYSRKPCCSGELAEVGRGVTDALSADTNILFFLHFTPLF